MGLERSRKLDVVALDAVVMLLHPGPLARARPVVTLFACAGRMTRRLVSGEEQRRVSWVQDQGTSRPCLV